jgi:hypothetical protein
MLHRFQHGTIVSLIAGENIKNNDLYIVDPNKQSLRKPKTPDEWLTCQLAYVYNPEPCESICAGSACRCWIGYLII